MIRDNQSAEGTTEKIIHILSHLRRFDFFCVNFCRGSAYASPPAKSSLSQRRKLSQSSYRSLCEKGKHFDRLSDLVQSSRLRASSPSALGIGAASFWSAAEKDIAESPTASPERPRKNFKRNSESQNFRTF